MVVPNRRAAVPLHVVQADCPSFRHDRRHNRPCNILKRAGRKKIVKVRSSSTILIVITHTGRESWPCPLPSHEGWWNHIMPFWIFFKNGLEIETRKCGFWNYTVHACLNGDRILPILLYLLPSSLQRWRMWSRWNELLLLRECAGMNSSDHTNCRVDKRHQLGKLVLSWLTSFFSSISDRECYLITEFIDRAHHWLGCKRISGM